MCLVQWTREPWPEITWTASQVNLHFFFFQEAKDNVIAMDTIHSTNSVPSGLDMMNSWSVNIDNVEIWKGDFEWKGIWLYRLYQ
jgi:hypothetical protein